MAATPMIQFEKSLLAAVAENPNGVIRIISTLIGMASIASARHLARIPVIISHFTTNYVWNSGYTVSYQSC